MGRFLQNLIRSGGRPLARKGATRRSVLLPELDVERTIPDARQSEAPPVVQPEPPVAAQAAPRDGHDRAEAPPPSPPLRAEADPVRPSVPQQPEPSAVPLRGVERVAEIVPPAKARPAQPTGPDVPAVAARAAEPPREAADESPLRDDDRADRDPDERPRAVVARLPVPSRVETLQSAVQPAFARRVTPPRESSAPEGRTPAPSRVEFQTITETRVVRSKPIVQAIAQPASEPAPQSPRSEPSLQALPAPVAPPAAPAQRTTLPNTADSVAREPQPPRESRSHAPAPAIAASVPIATPRRDNESTVNIRQLDIQIVGDEPQRRPARQQPAPAAESRGVDSFQRLYLREGL